jgi:RNA polymerase sigma-70 factor (ECF subfamily)
MTEAFDQIFRALRPRLHRYCARMTGSAVDGEDVVQQALVQAWEALAKAGMPDRPDAWLFRIAHNAALDFLRRRNRREAWMTDTDPETVVDPISVAEQRQTVAASLHLFMHLPPAQRGAVVLMDVLGYSLQEIVEVLGLTLPAVKAALHRGRARLRELGTMPDDRPRPALSETLRRRLAAYVAQFNARDFDAIRAAMAEEVRLDLVGRTEARGRQAVGRYFTNYAAQTDWHLVPGLVDGRPAAVVHDPATDQPVYFVLLDWTADGSLAAIRDFRYARYALEGAEIATDPS